jgi:hypothetical protein
MATSLKAKELTPKEVFQQSVDKTNQVLLEGAGAALHVGSLSSVVKSAHQTTLKTTNLSPDLMVKSVTQSQAHQFCNSPYGKIWRYFPPELLSKSSGEDGLVDIVGVEERDGKVYYQDNVVIYAKRSNEETVREHKRNQFKKRLGDYTGEGKGPDKFRPQGLNRALERDFEQGTVKGEVTLDLADDLLGKDGDE